MTKRDLDPYWRASGRTDDAWIRTCINQSRRFVHLHSVIYYHLGTSIVSDRDWDLRDLHSERIKIHNEDHPKWAAESYRPDLFMDWDGSTGIHLPMDDRIGRLADMMLRGAYKARPLNHI